MRIIAALLILISPFALKAQYFAPNAGYMQRPAFASGIRLSDSIPQKKWFVSSYSGISTSFSFFKGGNATIVSAPMGLQLNRMLNNNLYAYAGISVAPSFINFNSSYAVPGMKGVQNNSFKTNSFGVYSAASFGLTYVNDARTFSISGGVSIERSDYPGFQYNQPGLTKPNMPALPVNDDKRLH